MPKYHLGEPHALSPLLFLTQIQVESFIKQLVIDLPIFV